MAIKKTSQGFALLVAVIFMSVMLTFGLVLASLSYKQQVLASNSIESQFAFYVADAALECALYYDQRLNLFAYAKYDGNPKTMTCGGNTVAVTQAVPSPTLLISTALRFPLDSGKRCADVTVYKPPQGGGTSYLFALGYDVSCATVGASGSARFVVRGIRVHY